MSDREPLGFLDTFLVALGAVTIGTLPAPWFQKDLEKKIDQLLSQQTPAYELRVENVVGREAPEKFYEINGEKAYVVIDGKAAEQYFVQER